MMKFFAENLVMQSRVYPTSENKLFPASNLFDYRRSKVYRSMNNLSNVVFDFQEKSFVDTVIIVPSKSDFFGFTKVFLQLDLHGDFTDPLLTQEIPIFDSSEIATITIPKTEARFAKIAMESTLGYCELSKVFIGEVVDFGEFNGVDHGWKFSIEDLSAITKNQHGQIFSDKMPRQKRMSFKFTTMFEDEMNALTQMTDRLGLTKPLFILVDNNNEDQIMHRRSGMYRLTDIPDEENRFHGLYDMSFRVEEVM